MKQPGILVFGAGSIGLYLGGRLAAAGVRVHFVGRPAVCEVLGHDGLEITGLDGRRQQLAPSLFGLGDSLSDAPDVDLILLTVKGPATETAGAALAARYPAGQALVVFQNGVDSLPRLEHSAPGFRHHAGMVPFNVVQSAPGKIRQTTSGVLAAADSEITRQWAPRFAEAGLPLDLHADMQAVQWGKLLLNLNNPVNAVAGIPLREQLMQRGYRRLLADLQAETLGLLRRAAIRPAQVTPLPPALLPHLLRLPTALFQALARRMLTISPEARSSMLDDREAGRVTEVDDLCGAVVRLAESMGLDAPLNRRMRDLVQSLPQGETLDAETLGHRLRGLV